MAIGNLREEIRQDHDPYANIAQCGVLHAQLNSVMAMMPELKMGETDSALPHGAKDLGEGYTLLHACEDTTKLVTDMEAQAIMTYWAQQHWPNQNMWPKAVKCWARLQLLNGQTACSHWYESCST